MYIIDVIRNQTKLNQTELNMKAYQVFSGHLDERSLQYYTRQATYLDYQRAFAHSLELLHENTLWEEQVVEQEFEEGLLWYVDRNGVPVVLAKLEEVFVTK